MIRESISPARRSLGVLGVALLLAVSGCNKDKDKNAEAEAEAKTAAAAGDKKKAGKGPKDEGIDVPTEEDFEATVEAQITAETDLQKELDEIEKQIGQ